MSTQRRRQDRRSNARDAHPGANLVIIAAMALSAWVILSYGTKLEMACAAAAFLLFSVGWGVADIWRGKRELAQMKADADFVAWMASVNTVAWRDGWRECVRQSPTWRARFDAGMTPLQALTKAGILGGIEDDLE
jgi:hypothetical protein